MICLLLAIPCQAEVLYVDDDGPADFNNIQAAIDDSNAGDEIIVAEGTYVENINFNGKNIVLRSTDPNNPNIVADTIIDGNQNGSVITFENYEDANCVLNGFTITDGDTDYGGGIFCSSDPTIINCTFRGNSAGWEGGGMYNRRGNPTLINCIFTENWAEVGGGMYNSHSSPTLTNCIFTENLAEAVGGMGNYHSSPTVINSMFIGNVVNCGAVSPGS